MTLTLHIIIAITSIILATYVAVKPQALLIKVSYALVVATLGTGVILTLNGASVLHMCASGFAYSLVAVGSTEVARRRLLPFRSSM